MSLVVTGGHLGRRTAEPLLDQVEPDGVALVHAAGLAL